MYIPWILAQLKKLKAQIDNLVSMIYSIVGLNALTFKGIIYSSTDFPNISEVQNGWTYEIATNVIDDDPSKTNSGISFLKNDEIAWDGTKWVTLGADPKTTIGVSSEHEFLQAVDYLNKYNGGIVELLCDIVLAEETANYQIINGGIDLSKVLIRSAAPKVYSLMILGLVLRLKGTAFKVQDINLQGGLNNVSENTICILEVTEHLQLIEFDNTTFYNVIGQNSDTNPAIRLTFPQYDGFGINLLFFNCDIYTTGCSSSEFGGFSIENSCPWLYAINVRVVGQSKTRLNNRVFFHVFGNKLSYSNDESRRVFITDTSADLVQVDSSLLTLLYSLIIQPLQFEQYTEKTYFTEDDMFILSDADDNGILKKMRESTLFKHLHTPDQVGLELVRNDTQLIQVANLSDIPDKSLARTNLELGDAATKNVGTTSGSVAAGDHSHSGEFEPANSNIQSHIGNLANPHETTKEQIGLGNVSNDAQLKASSNLSDLQSGTIARINLGLGDSATKNVGTTAETVAQGNHNHTGTYEPANSNIQLHIGSITNPHNTTKAQVGLSNVSNDLQLKAASNLSDLLNAANARANLGLGDSATKNVGTASGTVAAGDHTHSAAVFPFRVREYSASVNLKNTGVTTIFNTESGKGRFICTKCWVHADNVVSLGLYAPTISIGYTAVNYSDFVSGQTLPNSSFATNQYVEVAVRAQSASRTSATAATDIKINVTQASDAAAYTCTVFVEGYYLQDYQPF